MSELLTLLVQFGPAGATVAIAIVFAWVQVKRDIALKEERLASEKRYVQLVESDQKTREGQTRAITSMYENIEKLNHQDFKTQQTCTFIREAMEASITKLDDNVTRLENHNKRLVKERDL